MCSTCESPERVLWTYASYPTLDEVALGNWMCLRRCPDCGHLWCEVPHEPYASFTFLTSWPYAQDDWQRIHDQDNATTLHEWHDAVIRENWQGLASQEREAIDRWRDRTYRHYNPIDRGPDVPIPKKIKRASDIDRVLRDVA